MPQRPGELEHSSCGSSESISTCIKRSSNTSVTVGAPGNTVPVDLEVTQLLAMHSTGSVQFHMPLKELESRKGTVNCGVASVDSVIDSGVTDGTAI